MKLAAWKYFSLIMALVLALGTGVTALVPAVPAAAAGTHGWATDNSTGKSHRGPSENRTHPFPGFSQNASSASGYIAGNGSTWWVSNDGGNNDNPGTQALPWATIAYALNTDNVTDGDTIRVVGTEEYYYESLEINKSVTIIGDGPDTTWLEPDGRDFGIKSVVPGVEVTISGFDIQDSDPYTTIWADDNHLTIINSDVYGSANEEGACVWVDNCTLTMTNCFLEGTAYTLDGRLDGGGIYATGDSDVFLTDCYFFECDGSAGGAIYMQSSDLTVERSLFDGNWEEIVGDGAGIYVDATEDNCTVNLNNCTFYGLGVDGPGGFGGDGGGIYVYSQDGYADVTLKNCTFKENITYDGVGAGLYQTGDNSTTYIRNCIFDNYFEYGGENIYADGGTIDSDYNIYSDTPVGFTRGSYDQVTTDPMCYDLADNGGLTPTCAIDIDSPACDNGTSTDVPAYDQREVPRPQGAAYDIGAYEWVAKTYASPSGSDNPAGLNTKKYIYAAVNLAGPGGATDVAEGNYLEENHWDNYEWNYYNIDISKPLTLTGTAGAAKTIIDIAETHRDYWDYDDDTIIDVYNGVTEFHEEGAVSISGFTVKNATGESCSGGGLNIDSEGVTTIQNFISENNTADYGGGGVYIDEAGQVALISCNITNNFADGNGGGIYAYYGDNVTISGCTVNGNEASGYGGGIYSDHCYIFSLTDSAVNGNTADSDGGGIYGERMFGSYDTLISRCTIANNISDGSGGGVYLYSMHSAEDNVTIEACTLSNNEATGDGGGLYNDSDSAVDMTNCTIYGNSLTDVGSGGINANAHSLFGGGIFNSGHAELLNCTVASNDAGLGGSGGGYYEEGAVTGVFKNSILANNTADGSNNDIAGGADAGFISNGYNICTTDGIICFDNATDKNSTPMVLGELADNGGPTFTCAISATSPAFNYAVDGPPNNLDQRGEPRPGALGGYDVGAYELQSDIPPTVPTITSMTPASGNQGQCPMTVIINGTNLTGATAVSFGTGITVSGLTVNSATQITATICINATATAGARNVSVTTPGGTGTKTGGFTVVQQTQQIGSGAPTSHGSGSTTGPTTTTQPVGLPNIQPQSASLSATTVTPGTPVTVTVSIANKSAVNGNKKVTLYVNGQVETTQGITVNSGGSTQLTFTVSRSEPGNYMVYVDGVPAGSFKVELFRESDMVLIFSVTMLAMAFIVGMIMLWRRQQGAY